MFCSKVFLNPTLGANTDRCIWESIEDDARIFTADAVRCKWVKVAGEGVCASGHLKLVTNTVVVDVINAFSVAVIAEFLVFAVAAIEICFRFVVACCGVEAGNDDAKGISDTTHIQS